MPDALVTTGTTEACDFRELLVAALPHLRAYARSLTGSADQADDLVQDTALRLLGAQEQYKPGTNFRAWAIVTLRNRFFDIRRRAKFHGGSIEDIDTSLLAQQPPQEAAVYFEEAKREFRRLSETCRAVITMIGINGMSYEQAAKKLRVPIGTVRSRIARARAILWYTVEGVPTPRDARGNLITRRR